MLRALVLSNMRPLPGHPERGSFVRDQVKALQSIEGLEVELFESAAGGGGLARGAAELKRRYGRRRFDVVHAHFGLTAWPALAVRARVRALTVHGSDLHHPRSRLATRLALPFIDVLGAASPALLAELPDAKAQQRAQVLPCGVDLERFRPLARDAARRQLGLDAERPYLLFPADPARAEKRHDRALAVAGQTQLLTLEGVEPGAVPLWINAANAVLVTSEREGFGLAVLEALACDVPVLATPVGIHHEVLDGVAGTLCAPFEVERWREALAAQLADPEPRVDGIERAAQYSTTLMAHRVAGAWRDALLAAG